MSKNIEYNYMAVKQDGKVVGIFAMEVGSENERIIVEKAVELEFKIEKSTKEEYESFGDQEIEIAK